MQKYLLDLRNALENQPLSVISIVAASSAVLSAISAWRSSRAARENFRMAKIDFEEKHDSIRAHLVESVTWDSGKCEKIASFACTYSNAANAPNTLERVELLVCALNSDGTNITVVLDPIRDAAMSHRSIRQLEVPLNLAARSTASGWVSFILPKYLLDTKRIDKYQIVASTSTGKVLTLDSHLLTKIKNANWKN